MSEWILWNLKARLYRIFRHRFPFGFILQRENESFVSLLNKIPQDHKIVLDLGTGEGNALQFIDGCAFKVGVDSSLSMLSNAQQNLKADFVKCDIFQLPFKNEIADLVLVIGVLEYFSEFNLILHEIYRVTKRDAYVIVSFSPNNFWTLLRQFSGHKIYPTNFNNFLRTITKNNFNVIEHRKLMMQHQLLIKKIIKKKGLSSDAACSF